LEQRRAIKGFFVTCGILLVLLVLVGSGWLYWQLHHFLNTPLITKQPITYELKANSTSSDLARELHKQGVLAHPTYLKWLARWQGDVTRLKRGEYLFPVGTTPRQLLRRVVKGQVIQYNFTIPEGWTFQQILQGLDNDPHIDATLKGLTPKQVMARLGHGGQNAEGRFFPNTYRFAGGTKDTVVLKKAYQLMSTNLGKAWQGRGRELPYKDAYQALTVASMIEKETAIDNERPVIAGVILRRLHKHMRLQIDPTVIYGLGKSFDGSLTKADLQALTPYNTYRKNGLPPTPICSPGLNAIEAALHPVRGTYLYYVATGYGGHFFSTTLKAHQQAVAAYRKYLNKEQP